MPSPNRLNTSFNRSRGQSASHGEVITAESNVTPAGCDLELTATEEHELPTDDHECAVLFPKHVQKWPYICNPCGKMFELHRQLTRHLKNFHENKGQRPPATDNHTKSALSQTNTELAQSNSVVDDSTIQKLNMNEPSDDIGAICKLCGWVSSKSTSLEVHMQSHGREKLESKVYLCDACGMVFDVRRKFLRHVARHSNRTPTGGLGDNPSACLQEESKASAVAARAMCDICGWVCSRSSKTTSQIFLDHMRTHTGERPFKCGQCSQTFTRRENLERHEMLHAGIGRFLCQHCAQCFQQKASLLCHMYRKHADKLDTDPSKRPFSCRFCGERFYTVHHVRRHTHKQHESAFCEVCGKIFCSYSDLQNHKCTTSGAFGCNICNISYTSAARLNQHLLIHETNNVGAICKCQCCSEEFKLMTDLERHVVDIHCIATPQYHCNKCEKSFITEIQFKRHVRVHTATADALVCTVCGKRFKLTSTLSMHMATHSTSTGGQFQCNECGKTFNLENSLRQHMRVHNQNAFPCTVCGMKFTFLNTLTLHMLTHCTSGPYRCCECGKSFTMASTLKLHMRLHSEDAFTCDVCGKKFMFRSMLKHHMESHRPAGERRPAKRIGAPLHGCAVCGKLFGSKQMLEMHERIHSGAKPYLCNTCGRAFRQQQHLTRHMLTHSKIKPYCCSFCSKAYSSRFDLRIHSVRIHNVQLPLCRGIKTTDINNHQSGVSLPDCSEPLSASILST